MKTKVKMTKDMGRGVFAACNINKKIVVEISPCLKWNERDQDLTQNSFLRFYVFEGKTKRDSVLALGVGSLFNHSKKANVKYKYDAKRNVIVFTATRKIYKGEQLFIDYGYDPVEELRRWDLQNMKKEDPVHNAMVGLSAQLEKQMYDPSGDAIRVMGDPISDKEMKVTCHHEPTKFWDEPKSTLQKIKDFFKGLFNG